MTDSKKPLNERQVMLVTYVVNMIARDPAKIVDMVENFEKHVGELGGQPDDVAAITDFIKTLEAHMKDGQRLGFW